MSQKERSRGILSPADRAYLRGERTLSVQSERNARARIRDRVYDALLDFELLVEQLDAYDRELAVDSRASETEPFDALVSAVAFVYEVTRDTDLQFETVLHEGISVAEAGKNRAASVDFEVTYYGLSAETLLSRLERGESLTLTELAFLHQSETVRDAELARYLDADEADPDDGRIQSKVTSF